MRLLAHSTLLGLLLFVGSAPAVEMRDPYHHFFLDTFGNLDEELARARDEGKKGVLLFFEMDECPFCHWMKQNVLSREDLQSFFRQNFNCYTVDIEGDLPMTDFEGNPTTQKEFAQVANRVRATPVFAFYDLDGNRIVRFTGKTRDHLEFLWLGEFVVGGMYEQTNFTRYKRARREQVDAQ